MADSELPPLDLKSEVEPLAPKVSGNPLIFISHDTRDAELAEAVSKLLSSVSCGMLKSFRSSDKKGAQGIEYGLEWYPELMKKLNASAGVLCLLTERSLNRPWILFEAGVAKGKLNTPVHGIAFGISLSDANTGPFAQFQNSDDDEESLTTVVMQLLSRIPGSEPDREAVLAQVRGFIEKKDAILSKLGGSLSEDSNTQESSVARLFEEVKIIVQDLPSKLEGRIADVVEFPRRRKLRKFHPEIVEDILSMSKELSYPVGILMIFSLFRDEQPWLYELGKEFYDTLRKGDVKKVRTAGRELVKLLHFATHHPMFDMFGSKDEYFMLMELPRVIERYIHRFETSKRRPGETSIEG